ncbi:MAG: ABC-F family ATP-binding cassette domain-containing protein [Lachnospiraceae bacterium]|nr:ABC-F family ATP-binding cassette domain-containing protein [Lachnospiraceae bacterium]
MILDCHNISKSFGTDVILREASFHIQEHEKAALVGINGAGKTTFLRIIMGLERADEGEVTFAKGTSVGYLAQMNMLSGGLSIYDEVAQVMQPVIDMENSLREMEDRMNLTPPDEIDELMERYHQTQTHFEQMGGYAWKSEISGVLRGLGFSDDEFGKPVDSLSGGQKTRVALGKLLLSSPDLMLLDEPTNHLDLNSIEWLENYLLNYRGAVLVVAHDRYFLNRIVSKVIEIDRGHVTSFAGDYSAYSEKKKQLRQAQLRAWQNQQDQIRHQEEVIARLKSFNREKSIRRAESREKMLDRIERLEKPSEERSDMHLKLDARVESGRDVLSASNLSKSFEYPLFENLDIEIKRGERVALIGNNGTGKSTLLKILIGQMDADSGSVTLGTNVHIGYYDQEHQILHPDKNLFQELQDAYPSLNNTQIRDTLAAFLFTGEEVFKLVRDLSGGERGRLSLAKLMLSGANFLILDEPTNHLDILSKEILEDAICAYSGTVLCVSHDRWFINRTATRILDLTGQTLIGYAGNYDYYLEKHDELTQRFASSKTHSSGGVISSSNASHLTMAQSSSSDTASAGRTDWKKQKQQQAMIRKKEARLRETEDEIASLEERGSIIDDQLSREEIFTDIGKVTELTTEKADIEKRLEALYDEWASLAE